MKRPTSSGEPPVDFSGELRLEYCAWQAPSTSAFASLSQSMVWISDCQVIL